MFVWPKMGCVRATIGLTGQFDREIFCSPDIILIFLCIFLLTEVEEP